MARKQRKCRACKKRPVWRGGDVKDPGPFCKQCYHKRWRSARPSARATASKPFEPDYNHCPECGVAADVCAGGTCPSCFFDFSNALYGWFGR